MNILVTKRNGTIEIDVSVEPITPKGDEVFVDTRLVKQHLRSKGVNFGTCLKSCVVSNTSEKRLGQWVFEDLDKKVSKPSKKKTSKRRSYTRKSTPEVDLDKADQPVVELVKEENSEE